MTSVQDWTTAMPLCWHDTIVTYFSVGWKE